MSNGTETRRGDRPGLGLVAQVAGAIGVIVCVLAIVGTFAGRSWIDSRVEVLEQDAIGALSRAIEVTDRAGADLAAGITQAAEVRTAAETLAAQPTLEAMAIQLLQERLNPITQQYITLRDQYVAVRERATVVIDTMHRLGRLIPGLELPEGPVDLVTQVDEHLMNLDQVVTDVASHAASRAAANEIATGIAESATRLESGLEQVNALTVTIHADFEGMQDDVSTLGDRIDGLVSLVTWVVVLLLIWVLVLNVALIALGRRWRSA